MSQVSIHAYTQTRHKARMKGLSQAMTGLAGCEGGAVSFTCEAIKGLIGAPYWIGWGSFILP